MANIEFKCPCCGGTLQFDQSTQKVVCPYCDSEYSTEDLKQYTDELNNTPEEDTSWDESKIQEYTNEEMSGMKVYSCNSCGGEIIVEQTTSSTSCPYCNNNLLVAKELSGDLKPNYIISFKKNKEDATSRLKSFFRKKILLPSSFSKTSTIEEIKSLYVPFWIFDAGVDGTVRYKGEKVRTWSDSQYNYKEVRHYSLIRGGYIAFEHVPVDGSKKMQDELMESIEPFDFKEAVDFNAAYLAGYAADRYDVTKEETFGRATERFRDGTVQAFRRDIHGYSAVSAVDSSLRLSNTKANYALYPVWTLNTKWKDKTYNFAMNGQTGKIAGNLPISWIKFTILTIFLFALFFALGWGAGHLFSEDGVVWLILGAVLGIGAAGGIMFALYRQNKNVRFQSGALPYEVAGSCRITTRRDIFLYKTTSRTKRASSNNNKR